VITEENFLDNRITVEEIEKAIKSTKNMKSSGPDHVVYEIFKNNPSQIQILEILYNSIFQDKSTPWELSWMIPIYKKGDKNNSNSYRCLNLSSCVEKVLTKILNDRLNTWIDRHGLIHECQTGFRKENSTLDNIWMLKEIIQIYKNSKKQLYICFIDLSKAFDSIPKYRLINKLRGIIPNGHYLSLMENVIDKKKYKILLNGAESEEFILENGIPQGDSLSPTLFCLYINDFLIELHKNINNIDPIKIVDIKLASLVYADDIVLFSESQQGLIKQIKHMKTFCNENGLTINYNKTKIMIHNEKENFKELMLKNDDDTTTSIEIVEEYKYLGIWIAKTDRKHIEEITKKGRASSYLTAKTLKEFGNINSKILNETFEMLTLSKMKYGCEFYFDRNLNDPNKIIMQFYKKFHHLRITTPNYCIIGEFDVKPMEFHCYKSALNYYLKLKTKTNQSLVTRLFNRINHSIDKKLFHNTWCNRILKLMEKIHLQKLQNIDIYDKRYKTVVNNRLTEYFRSEWINSAKNSNKGLRYLELCRFQSDMKQYLCLVDEKIKTDNILKLRTGNHTLAAEVGTYQNRSTHDDFTCKLCENDVTEDIYHFVSICSRYNAERRMLIPFLADCTRSDFYEIMNTLKIGQIKAIDEFIDKAMQCRNNR